MDSADPPSQPHPSTMDGTIPPTWSIPRPPLSIHGDSQPVPGEPHPHGIDIHRDMWTPQQVFWDHIGTDIQEEWDNGEEDPWLEQSATALANQSDMVQTRISTAQLESHALWATNTHIPKSAWTINSVLGSSADFNSASGLEEESERKPPFDLWEDIVNNKEPKNPRVVLPFMQDYNDKKLSREEKIRLQSGRWESLQCYWLYRFFEESPSKVFLPVHWQSLTMMPAWAALTSYDHSTRWCLRQLEFCWGLETV